eukprot:5417543-Amphidinium_carterae.1
MTFPGWFLQGNLQKKLVQCTRGAGPHGGTLGSAPCTSATLRLVTRSAVPRRKRNSTRIPPSK